MKPAPKLPLISQARGWGLTVRHGPRLFETLIRIIFLLASFVIARTAIKGADLYLAIGSLAVTLWVSWLLERHEDNDYSQDAIATGLCLGILSAIISLLIPDLAYLCYLVPAALFAVFFAIGYTERL